VIAILERGTPQLAVQGDPNVRFDPLKLTWLAACRPTRMMRIFCRSMRASRKAVGDLKSSGFPARLGTPAPAATN